MNRTNNLQVLVEFQQRSHEMVRSKLQRKHIPAQLHLALQKTSLCCPQQQWQARKMLLLQDLEWRGSVGFVLLV